MKINYIALLLIIFTGCQNQSNVHVENPITTPKAKKTPVPFVTSYDNGKMVTTTFKGLQAIKTYYDSKKLKQVAYIAFKDYKGTGSLISKSLSENGDILFKTIVPYLNGKKHGIERYYTGTRLEAETPYLNGNKHGTAIEYFNGQITREIVYKNGKKHGIERRYINSTLSAELTYINGKKEGVVILYLNNKVEAKIPYKNNKVNGVLLAYNKGNLLYKVAYKDNKKQGLCEAFYYEKENNYALEYKINFIDNKAQGIGYQYFPNGSVYVEINFESGIPLGANYGFVSDEIINNSQANDFGINAIRRCEHLKYFKRLY